MKKAFEYSTFMVAFSILTGLTTTMWLRVTMQGHHELLGYAVVLTIVWAAMTVSYVLRKLIEEQGN